jgi:hypothetical protein
LGRCAAAASTKAAAGTKLRGVIMVVAFSGNQASLPDEPNVT